MAMSVKFECAVPDFFANMRKAVVEDRTGTGRIYFLIKGKIVAVAIPHGVSITQGATP